MQKTDSLISLLKQECILDAETLASAIDEHEKTGQSLLTILKRDGSLDEEQLTKVLAVSSGIEFINLAPEMVDPMVAHLVSYKTASQHNLIPIKREDNLLRVAMSSPLNLSVRDQIEMKTGYKVVPVAATPAAIRHAIQHHFDVTSVTKQAIVSMRMEEDPAKTAQAAKTEYAPAKVGDSPVAKLVSSVIDGAIDARASDVHVEPQGSDVRVRYRVDGTLRTTINVPLSVHQEMVSHIKIMANMDISERRVPQDGHLTMPRDGQEYDLRVSSLPSIEGEKMVIRILNKSSNKWSTDQIITCPEDNQKFRSIIENPYGMLLLTGPTGCGKTTTLYALLQLLNVPEKNIVTVEDPVEYRLEGITQVQVRPVAGRTFASALRSILRQDPDIILIGEIRDVETAEIAVSAALTGHLVLSTLHTNDAAGAISRLINLGVPPYLVASALLAAVAQRLMRVSCPNCKQAYEPSEHELQCLFGKSYHDKSQTKLYRGAGCESCGNTGHRGRKSVYELLTVSPQIRRMISGRSSDQDIKQQAIAEGMRTLFESAANEVLEGVTMVEELTRIIDVEAQS
ncbi:MAG: type II/IV secretion system protein [Phycisphaerales bacterium]|nr:MAG: type II/IV secretion system protein [Phycisphaerales bacterium]